MYRINDVVIAVLRQYRKQTNRRKENKKIIPRQYRTNESGITQAGNKKSPGVPPPELVTLSTTNTVYVVVNGLGRMNGLLMRYVHSPLMHIRESYTTTRTNATVFL